MCGREVSSWQGGSHGARDVPRQGGGLGAQVAPVLSPRRVAGGTREQVASWSPPGKMAMRDTEDTRDVPTVGLWQWGTRGHPGVSQQRGLGGGGHRGHPGCPHHGALAVGDTKDTRVVPTMGLWQWGTHGHPGCPDTGVTAAGAVSPRVPPGSVPTVPVPADAPRQRLGEAEPGQPGRGGRQRPRHPHQAGQRGAAGRGGGPRPSPPCPLTHPPSPELPAEAQRQLPQQGVEEEVRDLGQQRAPLLPPQHQRERPRPHRCPRGGGDPHPHPRLVPAAGLHPQHPWEGDGPSPDHRQGPRQAAAPRHLRLRPLRQHQRAGEGRGRWDGARGWR